MKVNTHNLVIKERGSFRRLVNLSLHHFFKWGMIKIVSKYRRITLLRVVMKTYRRILGKKLREKKESQFAVRPNREVFIVYIVR